MKLDYDLLLSPAPIKLSIGTVIKHKLIEISEITFAKFNFYEFLLKLTPELFYKELGGEEGKDYWESLSKEDRESLLIYDIIAENDFLQTSYEELFNYFFVENVFFEDGFFILTKQGSLSKNQISKDDIKGIISKDTFPEIVSVLKQICCMEDEALKQEERKYKNSLAKKLLEKMDKASKQNKKSNINYSLPNIISAVSNRHPTISPINVWDLTLFQLFDSFNRTQTNMVFDIDSTRVSVWGDEKKSFNAELWFKNEYDKR